MSINLIFRVPLGANASTFYISRQAQPAFKVYFRPNPQAYARANNAFARFSPSDVAQARCDMYVALMSMQVRRNTAVAQIQALRVLLQAYAGLRARSFPASPQQVPARAQSVPASPEPASPTPARPTNSRSTSSRSTSSRSTSSRPAPSGSSNASGKSHRSQTNSSRTHASSSTPPPRAKPESNSSSSRPQNAGPRSSTNDAKGSENEKPREAAAPSYSIADAFKIMGLSITATAAEAKKAYYKAAREHHPDKGGNAEKFKVLNNAYEAVKLHFEKVGA